MADYTVNLNLEKIAAGTKPWYQQYWDNLDLIDANNPKHNFNATAAPTSTDDSSQGYAVGSIWIDTTNKVVYQCVDATQGAAVWKETTGAGSGSLTFLDLSDTPSSYSGKAGLFPKVNDTEDGLEFASGAGGDTLPVVDTTSIVKGSEDDTKQVRFEVDNLSTGTTRVLTIQDKDITIAGTDDIPATTDDLAEGTTNKYDKTVSISGGTNVTIGGTYPSFSITDNSAAKGDNSDITSLSGLTTPLSKSQGGTGNTTGDAYSVSGKVPTVTPTADSIPIANANGYLNDWINQGSGSNLDADTVKGIQVLKLQNVTGNGTVNIDLNQGTDINLTLTADTTITFTDPTQPCNVTIKVIQDATGGWILTLPTILWVSGISPTLATTAGNKSLINLRWDGTDYLGAAGYDFG